VRGEVVDFWGKQSSLVILKGFEVFNGVNHFLIPGSWIRVQDDS
jgi:hypothetical protein